MLDLSSVNRTWTLFLDRDGVINHDKPDSYIFHPREFAFYEGVLKALAYFNQAFLHIIIVTNQRGVGRGLMSEEDLLQIHDHMLDRIRETRGRIDRIYYCISMNNEDTNRKPNPGMAFQAKAHFPDIDLTRSIMVGNNISDMKFGRHAGMFTVFLSTTIPDMELPHPDIDLSFDSLEAFAKALQKN